jgi:hypothetical protein
VSEKYEMFWNAESDECCNRNVRYEGMKILLKELSIEVLTADFLKKN